MRVVPGSPEDLTNLGATHGSVFPAIELMMLAASARGVGTAMTTMLSPHEVETKALLGVPDLYQLIALIPTGSGRGPPAPTSQASLGKGPRRSLVTGLAATTVGRRSAPTACNRRHVIRRVMGCAAMSALTHA